MTGHIHDRLGQLDRSICGACNEPYVECSQCGILACKCIVPFDSTPAWQRHIEFDTDKLAEIMRLLAEAYEHYFAGSDGHCKSSEGAISINIPPFFWREDEGYGGVTVSIYSYVLGPSRQHDFRSVDAALETVRGWHAEEMATEYDEHGDVVGMWELCSCGNRFDGDNFCMPSACERSLRVSMWSIPG